MIIEITPLLTQQAAALVAKIAEVQQRLDALHVVADPIVKRIRDAEHILTFLREALNSLHSAARAVTSVNDDDIPF